jgi:hypothetical protein
MGPLLCQCFFKSFLEHFLIQILSEIYLYFMYYNTVNDIKEKVITYIYIYVLY